MFKSLCVFILFTKYIYIHDVLLLVMQWLYERNMIDNPLVSLCGYPQEWYVLSKCELKCSFVGLPATHVEYYVLNRHRVLCNGMRQQFSERSHQLCCSRYQNDLVVSSTIFNTPLHSNSNLTGLYTCSWV